MFRTPVRWFIVLIVLAGPGRAGAFRPAAAGPGIQGHDRPAGRSDGGPHQVPDRGHELRERRPDQALPRRGMRRGLPGDGPDRRPHLDGPRLPEGHGRHRFLLRPHLHARTPGRDRGHRQGPHPGRLVGPDLPLRRSARLPRRRPGHQRRPAAGRPRRAAADREGGRRRDPGPDGQGQGEGLVLGDRARRQGGRRPPDRCRRRGQQGLPRPQQHRHQVQPGLDEQDVHVHGRRPPGRGREALLRRPHRQVGRRDLAAQGRHRQDHRPPPHHPHLRPGELFQRGLSTRARGTSSASSTTTSRSSRTTSPPSPRASASSTATPACSSSASSSRRSPARTTSTTSARRSTRRPG